MAAPSAPDAPQVRTPLHLVVFLLSLAQFGVNQDTPMDREIQKVEFVAMLAHLK